MHQVTYKLKPLRKEDTYTVQTVYSGIVNIKGTRTIGEFFFRTGQGKFHKKDNYDSSLYTAEPYTFPQEFVDRCNENLKLTGDNINYQFLHDPGHGWLVVPVWLIKDWELESQISPYSYISRDGLLAYLEEDSDMTKFLDRYKQEYGHKLVPQENSQGRLFIRGLPSFNSSRFSPLLSEAKQLCKN